jgi:serine/threonine protein kinase
LKPDNIIVDKHKIDHLKLIDFGVAKTFEPG